MMFSGVEFWFFLPAVVLLYWLLPRRAAIQNLFLLAASWLFYASWNPRMLGVLAAATVVDYLAGRYIHRQRLAAFPGGAHAPAAPGPLLRMRFGLAASLLYNLGQLAYFKYSGFFADSFNQLLSGIGLHASLPVLHIVLPLGISFYTLQKVGYIIDVYYGRIEPCRSPLTFATFVAFFPQLIAGPIVRGAELLPQLDTPRRLTPDLLRRGAGIFFVGFIKKAYVADFIGQYLVDPIFAHSGDHSTPAHWLALVGYAVQVFCDFSGYSEMAIGCGLLLGIKLPVNFNYPFFSRNLLEFWRRWHITLNNWLFDYIYAPLTTGTSWLRGRLDLGFLIVFLLSGLWHGAMWTFILWGALHGAGLVATRRWDLHYRGLCRKDRKYVELRKSAPYLAGAWAATQFFFLLTLIPFRAPSLSAAGNFARALVVPQAGAFLPTEELPSLYKGNLLICFAGFVAYHLLEWSRGQRVRDALLALPAPVRGLAYGLVIAFLMLFVPVASGTFIYANF